MQIHAKRFQNAQQALQYAREDSTGRAIRYAGLFLFVDDHDLDAMENVRAEFAFLTEHAGRIMTVPAF